jgi:hypothetical protein
MRISLDSCLCEDEQNIPASRPGAETKHAFGDALGNGFHQIISVIAIADWSTADQTENPIAAVLWSRPFEPPLRCS